MPGASHKLNNNEYKAKAVAMLASGEKQTTIAKKLGVSQPTVSRFTKKPDIKLLIEGAAQELIEQGLPPAVELILNTMHQSLEQGMLDDDHSRTKNLLMLRKLALKEGENILKSAGLLPSHAQAPMIQAIVNIEGDAILTPNVMKILNAHTRLMTRNSDNKAEVES